MNRHRIWTVFKRELLDISRNKALIPAMLIPLVIFTILPLFTAFGLPALMGGVVTQDPDLNSLLSRIEEVYPQFASLSVVEKYQVYAIRQFITFFLISPVMGAMSIATHSIIGEKTSRSLEALLASPIRTDELLLAKSLASAVVPLGATWLLFGFFAIVTYLLGGPEVYRFTLDSAAWGIILLIAPLIALFGLGLGVIVSSRSADPRTAQQIGGVVVLPLVGAVVCQSAGVLLLGLPLVLIGAVLLFIVDLVLLLVGTRLFNREQILTRWK